MGEIMLAPRDVTSRVGLNGPTDALHLVHLHVDNISIMMFDSVEGLNLWEAVKAPVGFAAANLPGGPRLVQPLLLCESPEKVRRVLQDYLKQTRFRNSAKITLQILECPSLVAVTCLTKQDNVFADLAAQDLLRQRLAGLKQMFNATHRLDFSAAPSSIPGLDLLNVSARTKARLVRMMMRLFKIALDKAVAALPGSCP